VRILEIQLILLAQESIQATISHVMALSGGEVFTAPEENYHRNTMAKYCVASKEDTVEESLKWEVFNE